MIGERHRELLLGLAVAGVAALLYAPSLANDFVWDDAVVIVGNGALRGDAAALFGGIDVTRAVEPTPYYRPLTLLSFLLEERLHGLKPSAMHLLNVLLHAAIALLVFRLARGWLADRRAALLAALLFAVHPVGAETVDFLSGGRNTMLACLFALGAYLVHRRAVLGDRAALAWPGGLLFLAGLLSKESAFLVLPFVAALELPRVDRADRRTWTRALLGLLPYAAGATLYLLLRRSALADAGARIELLPGLGGRLFANVYVIPRYLLSLAWPPSLSILYEVPTDLGPLALPLAASWLGILAAIGWLLTRGRSPATLFGLAWLAAFWLPVSGIVPFPSAPLADRYLYLPAIGLWLIVGDQASRFAPRAGTRRLAASAAAVLALSALGAASLARTLTWRSDVTLFSRFVEDHPASAFGHHNLGTALMDKARDLDGAEREFAAALRLDPSFPHLHTQLGYARLSRKDFEGALRHYDLAVTLYPLDAEAHLNRAVALEAFGRYDEAAAEYRRFLSTPGDQLPGARPGVEARLRQLGR